MTLNTRLKSHLPLLGIVLSVCLFFVATTYYPGGTTDSTTSVGYDWARNFISSLFAPKALNGASNPARRIAILAMLVFCASLCTLFKSISSQSPSRIHKTTIEISGIGAAVYAFLVVTPMHDLMINIGLPFDLIALFATLHLLYVTRRSLLFLVGSVCILLLLLSAAMYYGNVFFGLPVVQKASLVACVGWLVAVHYAMFDRESRAKQAPADSGG